MKRKSSKICAGSHLGSILFKKKLVINLVFQNQTDMKVGPFEFSSKIKCNQMTFRANLILKREHSTPISFTII